MAKNNKHLLSRASMTVLFAVIALAVVCPSAIYGQSAPAPGEPKSPVKSKVRGYGRYITEEGDTIPMIYLVPLVVYPKMTFKNKKEENFYWQTVNDVKVALPYAKLIAETLIETYEYIETFDTQKEREDYLKKMEKSIFQQYKPVLKKFSKRRAKVLIKLIQRETHQSSYEIVKAFLGSFRATFWQGFGKLFGVSLKGSYEPKKNKEDATIERIASLVELGLL